MKNHWLGENKSNECPTRVIYVDTETRVIPGTEQVFRDPRTGKEEVMEGTGEHKFLLGHARYAYRQGKWGWYYEDCAFRNIKTFHAWIEKIMDRQTHNRTVWMMSHNMDFDFPHLGLFDYLSQDNGWEAPRAFVLGHPFLYYTARGEGKNRTKLQVISSTNYFMESLKSLAPLFGQEKWEVDFENDSLDKIAAYCRQDVNCLQAIIEGLMKFREGLGNWGATMASMALHTLMHGFLPDESVLVHDFPKLYAHERVSYRGGRVEVGLLETELDDVWEVDINSQYPSVMQHGMFPCEPRLKAPTTVAYGEIPEAWKCDYVTAKCQIELKRPCIAVRRDDRLVHPIGKLVTVLTQDEMDYLNTHPDYGHIDTVLEAANYKQRDDVFTHFVTYCYGKRLEAKSAADLCRKNGKDKEALGWDAVEKMWKLILNSCYGKLGQRKYDPARCVPIDSLQDDEEKTVVALMKDANQLRHNHDDRTITLMSGYAHITQNVHALGDRPTDNTVTSIAAAVTAKGRMQLQRLRDIAGQDQIYYCDTDSLFTTQKGMERLRDAGMMHPTELGKLKAKHHDDFYALGAKVYRVDGKWKRKGVRQNAKEIAPNTFLNIHCSGSRENLRKGMSNSNRFDYVPKCLSLEYKKGIPTKSGWVEPLEFQEW